VTAQRTYNPPNAWRDSIAWLAPQHFREWDKTKFYAIDVLIHARAIGDASNYLKAAEDALAGIAYDNDRQIDDTRARRCRTCQTKTPCGKPYTVITVSVI
jgi:Holliday junction resolvase RusA-like endonuclease